MEPRELPHGGGGWSGGLVDGGVGKMGLLGMMELSRN